MDIILIHRRLIKIELDRFETAELGLSSTTAKKPDVLSIKKTVKKIIAELKLTPIIPDEVKSVSTEIILKPSGGLSVFIYFEGMPAATQIYTFEHSDAMIAGLIMLNTQSISCESALFYDGKYHLCIYGCSQDNFPSLNEYARQDRTPDFTYPVLQEYAELLVDKNAIETISRFFEH